MFPFWTDFNILSSFFSFNKSVEAKALYWNLVWIYTSISRKYFFDKCTSCGERNFLRHLVKQAFYEYFIGFWRILQFLEPNLTITKEFQSKAFQWHWILISSSFLISRITTENASFCDPPCILMLFYSICLFQDFKHAIYEQ